MALAASLLLISASRPADVPFRAHMIDAGYSEVAAVMDVNGDGRLDVVAAEHWYEAPTWKSHKFRDVEFSNGYVDAFSNLPLDVDEDGYTDLITSSWFGKNISWYKNPGKSGGEWKATVIDSGFNNEFSFLVDLNNDGKKQEIITQSGSRQTPQAWYELKSKTWVKHEVSPVSYGHGIGVGDVNGDGRADIVTPNGWLESQPDGTWKHHPDWDDSPIAAGSTARIQMGFVQVTDVNGDGRADIIAGNGHDYGVLWIEQGANGQFTKRAIDTTWSQAHGSALADINGDGKKDFITGKRYFAHNGADPGEREPLGLYWYEFQGKEWIRHIIEYGGRVGGGVAEIPVVDIDRDGDLDIIAAGKSGLFLLENLTRAPAPRGTPAKR